ncbi:MAG: hypothetical protein AABY03_00245 [Nanoarchaeota archaeon]
MDNEDFIRQYAEYLTLKNKDNLSEEEKKQMHLAYEHIRNYVISGEELIESDLPQYLPLKTSKDESNSKNLELKLDRIRKEINGKDGQIIDRLNNILNS